MRTPLCGIFVGVLGLVPSPFLATPLAGQVIEDWTATFHAESRARDFPSAVATDAGGNVFITGRSEPSLRVLPPPVASTVKLDSTGDVAWIAEYEGIARAVAADDEGGAVVTGHEGLVYGGTLVTVRYGPEGDELWRETLPYDSGHEVAFDPAGNVVILGTHQNALEEDTGYDYVVAKYSPDGTLLWERLYDGPERVPEANCDDEECDDIPAAMGVDCDGNVYVTGSSQGTGPIDDQDHDFATLKYDPEGDLLWVRRYDATAHGAPDGIEDRARDIAVDADGGVIVTGATQGPDGSRDFATVKYDSAGDHLWTRLYDGPPGSEDFATSVAVGSLGDVYVTGLSAATEELFEYAILKYSANGDPIWEQRFPGPVTRSWALRPEEQEASLVLDTTGCGDEPRSESRVVLVGTVELDDSDFDYVTIALDSDGNLLWRERFDEAAGSDLASAVAFDEAGNVLVTGSSHRSSTGDDYATIKYSPDGDLLWQHRYDGPGVGDEELEALAVDAAGNTYVTGRSTLAGTQADMATLKYDREGRRLWLARYNTPGDRYDSGQDLVVDGPGNVYVAGTSISENGLGDIVVVKYDPDGSQLWDARFDRPGGGSEVAVAVALDASGDLLVAGESRGLGSPPDLVLLKYAASGSRAWTAYYDGPEQLSEQLSVLRVDAPGNAYLAGVSHSRETQGDYVTVKISPTGEVLWAATRDWQSSSVEERIRDVAVDSTGNVYVTGSAGGDIHTVKYSPEGDELWARQYENPDSGWDAAERVLLDEPRSAVYVVGTAGRPPVFHSDFLALRYTEDGSLLWSARYDGAGGPSSSASDALVDGSGNIHVVGGSYTPVSGTDRSAEIAVFSPEGELVRESLLAGPALASVVGPQLEMDRDGAYLIAASAWSERTLGDYFLGRYVPTDAVLFRRGDCNADGLQDISDSLCILEHLFLGGAAPPCRKSADADDTGALDITDAVYILNFLFQGGAPPAGPFPDCGADGTPDGLDCGFYVRCE